MKLTTNELYQVVDVHKKLVKLSNRLNRLDTQECNGELKQGEWERKTEKIENDAENLAKILDFKIYHQTDPRGCSLYLINKSETKPDLNYTSGFAV